MALTDIIIRQAKPKDKQYKISDAKGLYLLVRPNGSKYFRLKYRLKNKEKVYALGVYPEVSLKEARDKCDETRRKLRDGIDPIQETKDVKRQDLLNSENNFQFIAYEWFESRKGIWTDRYAKKVLHRLQTDVFPGLGHRPIKEITAPELLSIVMVIEKRGAIELAHRILQSCGQIMRYGIATGRAERDISTDLRGALKVKKTTHFSYLKAADLPEFLDKLEAYDGNLQTKLAMKLLMLTFVRTGELRAARWQEIDFAAAEWRIPEERMKMKELHIVPLSHQAIAVLKELKSISNHDFLFPNSINSLKCMSENTILYALYRMGYHSRATGHGFRSTASTILNEHGFRPDVIERQLAHTERNDIRACYNHAQYLPERRQMMQWWADYIDSITSATKHKKVV